MDVISTGLFIHWGLPEAQGWADSEPAQASSVSMQWFERDRETLI